MDNSPPHKKFKIGQMVKVLYQGSWYVGRYYCRCVSSHGVRFPIHGAYGLRLEPYWVKDGPKIKNI